MNELKTITVYGLIWNFIERFINYFIQFIVGIVLARILSPKEFGLMGMLAIFISLSQVMITSGLNAAIIRKKDCKPIDYHSVFVFNIVISFLFFTFLYLLSDPISLFYDQEILKSILIVLAAGLVVESFGGIQLAKLQREMNFKLLSKIVMIASIVSGVVSITLALHGFGIWALVALHLVRVTLNTSLLWIFVKWKPKLQFEMSSFRELFAFGSKLLLSGIIDTIYNKGFYLLIGKLYSPIQLGFFNRADRFQNLVSVNISGWIAQVSYPMLSKIQDVEILKSSFKKIIKNVMFLTFILMFGLGATAESLILTLLGEKWMQSVPYLQMLVFVGMLYPVQSLNTDVLKVVGKSDLFLRVVIIKKAIAIPVMVITAFISIEVLIIGMILMSILSYIINVYWSSKFINYPLNQQVKDIYKSFFLALVMGVLVYYVGSLMRTPVLITLIVQVALGFTFIVIYCEIVRHSIYLEMKKIVMQVIKNKTIS